MYRNRFGWCVCGVCGEPVVSLVDSVMCAECEYIFTHDNVNTNSCGTCLFYDSTEYYTCTKHLEAPSADEINVFCNDFVFKSVEKHREMLTMPVDIVISDYEFKKAGC